MLLSKKITAFLLLLTCVGLSFNSWTQSVTATYSIGNISTNYTAYSATCNGPISTLTVTIPAGATVNSINISYSMTATGGAWLSEQRSQIHCQQTGLTEAVFSGTGGSTGGTENYSRTGVTIANGVSVTGTLIFEMRAWRTWGGTGCNSTYQFIPNNSWQITVNYTLPTAMAYVSSTSTQNNVQNIQNCIGAAEILGVNIQTSGALNPLLVSQFNLTTAGTSNLSEISAVRVYYSGSSPSFSTASLFGSAAPGAALSVVGSQTLVSGNNYFWIEYVLNPTLTNGNTFDGSCTSIIVAGINRVPSVTSPAGNRTVVACNPSPGGLSSGPQAWFNANNGTVGTPVTSWVNLGGNTNITALTSSNGGNLNLNDPKANFNNIVNTTGGYAGTFHAEIPTRTNLISGNQVTMYTAYQRQEAPDLVFEFHGSILTNSTLNNILNWLTWGFRLGGVGTNFGSGGNYAYNTSILPLMSENSGIAGLHGTSNSAGGNSLNGVEQNHANIGTFHAGGNYMQLSIGYWPGYGASRGVMEAIMWDRDLSPVEQDMVESYLAIKYGVTLGVNGVSMNYLSPSSAGIIWNATANAGYNYDIAGISRSDVSNLSQIKSHSTNGPAVGFYNDIVTVVNGNSFGSPAGLSADNSHFIWGHNGQPTFHTGWPVLAIPTDNGEIIETIFQRKWKSQETGTVGTITLEFDMSNVPGVSGVTGSNDLSNLRLLVDEDGDFTNGATSISPSSFNNTTNIAYFQHNFIPGNGVNLTQLRGFFFTLGSVNATTTPLPVTLTNFEVTKDNCQVDISWTTVSEQNSKEFVVEKSSDLLTWEEVCSVQASGNSTNVLHYNCVDRIMDNGVMYYRLKQIDLDGQFAYYSSESLLTSCSQLEPFLYPNPASDELNIESPEAGTMNLIDMKGRSVLTQNLVKGKNTLHLDKLMAGAYFIQLSLSDNSEHFLRFFKE